MVRTRQNVGTVAKRRLRCHVCRAILWMHPRGSSVCTRCWDEASVKDRERWLAIGRSVVLRDEDVKHIKEIFVGSETEADWRSYNLEWIKDIID